MLESNLRLRLGAAVVFISIPILTACPGEVVMPPPPPPAAIQVVITPMTASIAPGQTQTYVAQVTGGEGTISRTVTWRIDPATGVATLTANGNTAVVRGDAGGTVGVVATHTGTGATSPPARAAAVLLVIAPPVVIGRVDLLPASAVLAIGDTLRFQATVFDDAGHQVLGQPIAWSSTNTAIATISGSGLVTAIAVGNTRVIASVQGKSDTSTVNVVVAGNGRYAYAFNDNPTSAAHTVTAANSFSSANQPITITRSTPGEYQVQFTGMQPAAGQTQVFQVTTYGTDPVTCKVNAVTTSASAITARVHCYSISADVPADQRFVILMLGSGALPGRFAFGWADRATAEDPYTAAAMFNASGQPVRVNRDDNGVYTITFTGNSRPVSGTPDIALVTSTGATGSRCAVNSFVIDASLHVHCVGGGTGYFVDDDAAFMAVFLERGQPGRRFAFATITGQAAVTAGESHHSSSGAITATRLSTGRTDVTFAGLGRTASNGTETVQVVSRSDLGAYCKLLGWQTVGADLRASVQCYTYEGAPDDREFRILLMQ